MKGNNNSSALGAKTARACDSCLRVRARWFCAADDAFLCHGCDNLVHSANQLASRHERVRLQTSSSSKKVTTTTQAWHSGFTRKARTPRSRNKQFLPQQAKDEEEQEQEVFFNNNNSVLLLPLVPDIGSEELLFDDETDENMLCRVPVFDPFDSELCSVYNEVKDEMLLETDNNMKKNDDQEEEEAFDLEKFSELLPSDMDLAEFAADVESLLELDDSVNVKGSSKMVPRKEEELLEDDDEIDAILGGSTKGAMVVKVKDEDQLLDDDDDNEMACNLESILDIDNNNNNESFDWNINIDSESIVAAIQEQEEEQKVPMVENGGDGNKVGTNNNYKKERLLRLNYEEVIAAWDSHGCSPWTTGTQPKFSTDDRWQHYLGSSGADLHYSYGGVRSLRGHTIGSVDWGREARVSRYREKRRKRLFAKKIRYEVRKLNAEKRPRMKGRFVKRTSFVGDTTFPPQLPLTSK